MSTSDGVSSAGGRTPAELAEQVRFLEAEVSDLRLRLSGSPSGSRGLELRLAEAQRSLAGLTSQNERLAGRFTHGVPTGHLQAAECRHHRALVMVVAGALDLAIDPLDGECGCHP